MLLKICLDAWNIVPQVAQTGEAELPVVEAPNDGQPLVGDLELSEPVPEVKVGVQWLLQL